MAEFNEHFEQMRVQERKKMQPALDKNGQPVFDLKGDQVLLKKNQELILDANGNVRFDALGRAKIRSNHYGDYHYSAVDPDLIPFRKAQAAMSCTHRIYKSVHFSHGLTYPVDSGVKFRGRTIIGCTARVKVRFFDKETGEEIFFDNPSDLTMKFRRIWLRHLVKPVLSKEDGITFEVVDAAAMDYEEYINAETDLTIKNAHRRRKDYISKILNDIPEKTLDEMNTELKIEPYSWTLIEFKGDLSDIEVSPVFDSVYVSDNDLRLRNVSEQTYLDFVRENHSKLQSREPYVTEFGYIDGIVPDGIHEYYVDPETSQPLSTLRSGRYWTSYKDRKTGETKYRLSETAWDKWRSWRGLNGSTYPYEFYCSPKYEDLLKLIGHQACENNLEYDEETEKLWWKLAGIVAADKDTLSHV